MYIKKAYTSYEIEPFNKPFGFKGRSLTGGWQIYTVIESKDNVGVGLGMQSVLWSDSTVFVRYGEDLSNEMMFKVTKHALELIEGKSFNSPKEIIAYLFEPSLEYARSVTDMSVTDTFVLNALVSIDLAAWQLYSKTNGISNFDDIYSGRTKHDCLASIPLITYGTSVSEVMSLASAGTPLFKIKLGADPDGDCNLQKMLEWDMRRIEEIHNALKDIKTPFTDCGSPVYYFDANGRYDTKERLDSLVEFMIDKGIDKKTVLFEEPFSPDNKVNISDVPIVFAADESAHGVKDVIERISLGYKAITLKPIAKTLSVTIDMAESALSLGAGCFCADLTVSPAMVEWNKNFAARIPALSGMKIGILETNGHQNYKNYQKLKSRVPFDDNYNNGVFDLRGGFYAHSGGIFDSPDYYINFAKEFCENGGD